MKFLAYAKINIRLNVLGKTENNYHNLSMVNAKISLADEIDIFEDTENKVVYSLESLNKLENNLCLNVLNEITNKFNIKKRYNIYIKKYIPIGAGLGGGSSDIACIINALDKIHNLKLTLHEKINIGLKYGADVPYCLINDIALVEGIGEIITPLDVSFKKRVVVVFPNIFVSTKDVFLNVEKYGVRNKKIKIEEMINSRDYDQLLTNDLETPSFKLKPELKIIKENLNKIGKTVMSGSGSSMLVFIESDNQLKQIIDMYSNYLIVDSYIIK